MKNLAIITARSGSKGLPHKNIKPLCGKPLLAYSIIAARESGMYDKIVVSTDSAEYARIAREWGAEVPFFRSEQNSSDVASSWDTCREVIEGYKALGEEFDTFTLLQPTSPLRTAEDIRRGFEIMEQKEADFVVSVSNEGGLPTSPIPLDGSLNGFIERKQNIRRQATSDKYKLNGALYIVRTDKLPDDNFIYIENSYALIMPKERSFDIDTEVDFVICEALMNYFSEKK